MGITRFYQKSKHSKLVSSKSKVTRILVILLVLLGTLLLGSGLSYAQSCGFDTVGQGPPVCPEGQVCIFYKDGTYACGVSTTETSKKYQETEAHIRSIIDAFGSGGGSGGFLKRVFMVSLPVAVILGLAIVARSGYMIMTSQGDPRRVTEGKENLTAAIIGLLFVLLSIGILRAIIGALITDVTF